MRWITLVLLGLSFTLTSRAFVSSSSTEATLTYSHFVEIPGKRKPLMRTVRQALEDQVLHMFGPMSITLARGVPKEDHKFSNIQIAKREDGMWIATYDYEGTIQMEKGPRTKYAFHLPRQGNKEFLYDKKCTDSHYPDWEDFWYFWNPVQKGCRLVEGVHYDGIDGRIVRMQNSKRTYPEYHRLKSKLSNGDEGILFYLFFGMDDAENGRDPFDSKDENAASYRKARKHLLSLGFKGGPLAPEEFSRILEKHHFKRPYVESFRYNAGKLPIEVVTFFGPTGIWEASSAFHYFYKEASEKAGVMIYDGHSGLGEHLDLKAIEKLHGFKFQKDPGHFQIFFFNSCTSYTYYNTTYFYRKGTGRRKSRTKNLDIATNGLAAAFDKAQIANMALLDAVVSWAEHGDIKHYPELAKVMELNSLFSINGDEDNPIYEKDVQ